MDKILVKYKPKWRFKDHKHIQVTDCKRIFNRKTNRELKIRVVGYSEGFWLGKKFILKSKLNNMVERIPKKEYCPF